MRDTSNDTFQGMFLYQLNIGRMDDEAETEIPPDVYWRNNALHIGEIISDVKHIYIIMFIYRWLSATLK